MAIGSGLSGILCLLATAHGTPPPAQALLRSMRPTFSTNITAVVVQRDPSSDGAFQIVRVERDRLGHTRYTVLQPLRMQGVESVDDGTKVRMYFPDQNLIIDQDSPQRSPGDAAWRIGLAQRNYTLRYGPPTRVAGRSCLTIVATPKYGQMDVRRYYVDEETFYPLRIESEGDSGRTLYIDTKDILYPAKLPRDRFRLDPMGSPQVLRYHRPDSLTTHTAALKMGFTPIVPQTIPLGFRVQEMQLSETGNWRSVAVRITDGLVRATVYQWQAAGSRFDVKSIENSTPAERNGIRLLLVSDLDARLRQALLDAFVGRSSALPILRSGPVSRGSH